jgi:hypothetical protein
MSNGIEPVKIYNPLIGATGHVTTPEYILDEGTGKTQAEINKEQAEFNKTVGQGGIRINRITQYYAVHTSSTEAPEDGFQEDGVTPVWIPIPNDNNWEMPVMTKDFPCLWNYELIEYSDLSTYESPRICINVLPEIESGRGIYKIDYFYLVNNEPNITPEVDDPGWTTQSPPTTNENRYLWEKQEIYFTDKPEELEKTVIRILGVRGDDGIDGVNIEYIFFLGKDESEKPENPTPGDWEETTSDYQKKSDYIPSPTKTDEEGNPTEDGNWRDNEVSVSSEFPYLWTSKREYKNKKWGEFTNPTLWAKYGQDGNSVLEIVKYYQVSSDSQNHPSGIEETDIPLNPEECGETLGGWTKKSAPTTDTSKHLWCLEITYYTKLRRTYNFTLIGSKGDRGIDGSDVEYVYCCSPGKNIKPVNPFKPFESDEDWKTNPIYQVDDYNPEPIVDGDYIWDWTDEPTDPSEEFPYEWICERKKEKDENGDSYWDKYRGPYLWAKFGNDGAGLVSVKIAYLISDTNVFSDEIKGTSDTDHTNEENVLECLPGHWYNDSPAVNEDYPYLWKRTTTIASQAIYDDPETAEDETKTDTSVLYEVVGSLGKKGIDGTSIDYIYTLTEDFTEPDSPQGINAPLSGSEIDDLGRTWYDDPQGVDDTYPYQWISTAESYTNELGNVVWTEYGKPSLWSKFSIDGNGIVGRDVYYLISDSNVDDDIDGITATDETERPSKFKPNTWYRVSPSVNDTYKYLWKKSITTYLRDITGNVGGTNKEVSFELIGTAGERGVDGLQIEWAFKLTKTPNRPDSTDSDWPTGSVEGNSPFKDDGETPQWTDDASEINKDWNYLWYITREKKSGENWGPWGKLNNSDGKHYASIYSMYEEFKHESTEVYYITTEEAIPAEIPSEAIYTTLEEYRDALKNTYGWKISSEAPILTGEEGSKFLWKLSLLIYTGGIFEVDGPVPSSNYAGTGAFKSFAFKRSQGKPSNKPTGGSYLKPHPDSSSGWTDGIPKGNLPLWSSTRIFSWDGKNPQDPEWSDPVLMVDTPGLEILYCDYSSAQINSTAISGGNPVYGNLSINYSINSTTIPFSKSDTGEIDPDWLELANGCRWFDDSEGIDPIWMATSKYNNGAWSEWSIVKVKGEDGKDGENGVNGSDAVSLYIDKPVVICGIDPDTKKTLNTVSGKIKVKLMNGGREVTLDQLSNCPITLNLIPRPDDSSSSGGNDGGGTSGNTSTTTTVANTTSAPYTQTFSIETETTANTELSTDDNCYYINLEIPEDQERTDNLLEIEVTLKKTSEGLSASGVIQVVYTERGMVGPAGDKGPLLYPAGYWDAETEYTRTEQTVPFVYIQETDKYYVLEADSSKGENPKNYPGVWEEIEKIKYLFTEALMANWAKLAKAVFWGDYMFSSTGINRAREAVVDYSAYAESMFTNGKLSGTITPNLFLDFWSGEAKMNRLSMPFYDLPYGGEDAYKIDLGVSYNVKADINKVVFLPNPTEIKDAGGVVYDDTILSWQEKEADGVLCTIMAKPKPFYTEKYKTPIAKLNMQKDANNIPSIYSLDDNLTLVCADGRVSDYRSYYIEGMDVNGNENKVVYNPLKDNVNSFGQYDGKGYFLIEGVPVKFIVLEPGAILKLRSCYTTAGRYYTPATGNGYAKESEGIYWVVENASDFAQINFTAETFLNDGVNQSSYVWSCPSNPGGDSSQLEVAYGSSFIRYVQSKGTDSLQSSDMLKAQLFVSNKGVEIEENGSLFIGE